MDFSKQGKGLQNSPRKEKVKEWNDLEERLKSLLLRGIMAQITLVLKGYLERVGGPMDLLLVLLGGSVLAYQVQAPVKSRELVQSMALDTLFGLVDGGSPEMSILNLVGVYFLYTSFGKEGKVLHVNFAGTAQYLLVFRIASNLQGLGSLITMVIALMLLGVNPVLRAQPRIQEILSLTSLHLAQGCFVKQIPAQAQLVWLSMLVYAIAPFIKKFEQAADLYNFVIMTLTSNLQVNQVPYWTQSIIFLIIWMVQSEEVLELVSRFTLVRLVQLACMQALAELTKVDGGLVYTSMVVTFDLWSS